MFDNVIVGVDRAEGGRDALGLARELASADAQLTLAYVQVVPRPPSPPSGVVTEVVHAVRALELLASLRDASDRLRGKAKKRRWGRLFMLALVGAAIAIALNDDLRKTVLDRLFGAEEEFEYSSTTSSETAGSATG